MFKNIGLFVVIIFCVCICFLATPQNKIAGMTNVYEVENYSITLPEYSEKGNDIQVNETIMNNDYITLTLNKIKVFPDEVNRVELHIFAEINKDKLGDFTNIEVSMLCDVNDDYILSNINIVTKDDFPEKKEVIVDLFCLDVNSYYDVLNTLDINVLFNIVYDYDILVEQSKSVVQFIHKGTVKNFYIPAYKINAKNICIENKDLYNKMRIYINNKTIEGLLEGNLENWLRYVIINEDSYKLTSVDENSGLIRGLNRGVIPNSVHIGQLDYIIVYIDNEYVIYYKK